MSEDVEDLDAKTLRQLELPRTVQSGRGLLGLRLPKVIFPVFVVNDVDNRQHEGVTETPGANNHTLQAKVDERIHIFSMRYTYNATSTIGTRLLRVERRDKVSRLFNRYVDFSTPANTSPSFEISQGLTTTADVNVQLAYPIVLEPEWQINARDDAGIDAADSISIRADIVRIQL